MEAAANRGDALQERGWSRTTVICPDEHGARREARRAGEVSVLRRRPAEGRWSVGPKPSPEPLLEEAPALGETTNASERSVVGRRRRGDASPPQ